MADNAQRDLDEALPALEEAMKVSLHQLNIILRSQLVLLFALNVCEKCSGII